MISDCGESITSPDDLDAAVDRAGVHQHLARAEPPGVDLEVRAYSRIEGTKLSLIRSRCMRST